ncbi:MAG: hypothetical protein FVQ83_12180 [Chloroflexi bacterium]|nr:hypothetical protein [Chloroflexota bacterium]
MKNKKFLAFSALALITLACGVTVNTPNNSSGSDGGININFSDAFVIVPMVTEEIFVASLETDETAELSLYFGAGELKISPAEFEGLLSGTATYNVEEFKPEITVNDESVRLEQGSVDYQFPNFPNYEDVENEWDLQLSTQRMKLEINAGAYRGELELGGLSLETLAIYDGAASVDVSFSDPNLIEMESFVYATGASEVTLSNLANANLETMSFIGGLGDYELDFSGELMRDTTVVVEAGLGNVTIVVPEGVNAIVTVSNSLGSVSVGSAWSRVGGVYTLTGDGPTLRINVDIGAGSLDLRN